jgi:hypothetical protein
MIDLADIYIWATSNWQWLIIVVLAIAVIMFVRSLQ